MEFQNVFEALVSPGLHLSKEIILSQISEEKVWNISLGFEPNDSDIITSPYRKDNSPGCKFIRNKEGLLCLYDGAAIGSKVSGIGIWNVDCFQSLMILKGIDLGLCLSKIQELINVGKLEGLDLGFTKLEVIKTSNKSKGNKKTLIYYWTRTWNKYDKKYWSSYGITKSQLESDNIIPIDAWGVKSKGSSEWRKFICSHWCSYIINDDSWGSRMKGYQPFSKFLRFFGNVDEDCIGGLWGLNDSDSESDVIITKSYKDWRVLKNAGFQVIWFQNEGMIPDLKLLKEFKHRNFIILFDNDKAGIKAAIHVRDTISKAGFKIIAICLNRNFLKQGIKDSSDMIKEKPKTFNQIFNQGKLTYEIFKGRSYKVLETVPKKVHGL
tara:strand:- start:169 stop:1308 length:1140 start_codon:yes stop_codon:yes gene_type:complete